MPMYEYQCKECGLVFEARQKFSDDPLTECRECGGSVTKLISQTGFALKGGGCRRWRWLRRLPQGGQRVIDNKYVCKKATRSIDRVAFFVLLSLRINVRRGQSDPDS